MDGRRGRGRGRGVRRQQNVRGDRESAADQSQGPRVEVGEQVATAINRMTDILERMAGQQGPGTVNQPVNPEGGEDRALERFQKFSPPKFSGGPDPEAAEGWLERISDIFATLHYTEERQVAFATFQFEGVARSWWNMIKAKWDQEHTPRTWANFTREFNAKFLPPLVQEKREDDFIRCRQGTLSVAEYEALFTKLSRFAPELVATEQRRIRRFVQGLNVEIQEGLAAAQITSFTNAVEKAQRVESAKTQVRVFNARKRDAPSSSREPVGVNVPPPKFGRGIGEVNTPEASRGAMMRGAFSSGTSSRRGQPRSTLQGSQSSTPNLHCNYCGMLNHTEDECWRKEGKCLKCGSSEHQVATCPKVQERSGV